MTMHLPTMRRTILASTGLAATLATPLVLAHTGVDITPHQHATDALSSFVSGAVHPFSGLDHLAAMVSVGLWSALARHRHTLTFKQPGLASLIAAPAAFALTLLLGAVAGMAGLSLPGVEPMIATSLLVLGLLVVSRAQLGTASGAVLVAAFALFHGLAHGAELGGHAWAALSGMVLSTAALHAAGITAGLALRDRHSSAQRWLTRGIGVAVAALGASLLTPALAATI
jgi:urease accessory protein